MTRAIVSNPTALLYRLRRHLPLPAHGRPGLVGRLQKERPEVTLGSRLFVSNIYDGGEAGLMCAIKLDPDLRTVPVMVAPIDQIAIDRRHPLSREITVFLRMAAKRN